MVLPHRCSVPAGADCAGPLQLPGGLLPMFCHQLLHVAEPGAGEHGGQQPGGSGWRCLPPRGWTRGKEHSERWGTHLLPPTLTLQVAGVISSLVILVTILKIGELFRDLPKVHLALQPPCHIPPLCPSHGKVVWQGSSQGSPSPRPALSILMAAATSLLGHLVCHHHHQPQGHVQAV